MQRLRYGSKRWWWGHWQQRRHLGAACACSLRRLPALPGIWDTLEATHSLVLRFCRGSAWLSVAVQRSSSRAMLRRGRAALATSAEAVAAEQPAAKQQKQKQQQQQKGKQQQGGKKGEAKVITPKSEDFSR